MALRFRGSRYGPLRQLSRRRDAIIRTNEPLAPDAGQAKIYDGYFRLYDRLYQALKPEYKELTKLYY